MSLGASGVHRLEIATAGAYADTQGEALLARLRGQAALPLAAVRTVRVLLLSGAVLQGVLRAGGLAGEASGRQVQAQLRGLAEVLFGEGVFSVCGVDGELLAAEGPVGFAWDWWLEAGPAAGVTDAEGRSAQRCVEWWLQQQLGAAGLAEGGGAGQATLGAAQQVRSARAWLLQGPLSRQQAQQVAGWVSNPLVHRVELFSPQEAAAALQSRAPALFPRPAAPPGPREDIAWFAVDDAQAVLALSDARLLALNLQEAQAIAAHFSAPETQAQRRQAGLDTRLSDLELEMLAQTWSEHCKHKIFQARIRYQDAQGRQEVVDSLYRRYIQGATRQVRAALGAQDFCLSVFTDNAGVVAFDADWALALKVETHNSPSALDPYGGALTGILGANRDACATGRGAALLFNTNVFCFASPFYAGALPPGLLHPLRIYEGVRAGVEDGGNKCGVPTINGSLSFDARFLGKPLVFCGSAALLPRQLQGRPGHEKWVQPGDQIVMAGGRIGRDGIHGATFSSLELSAAPPSGAVQIGDPFVQKVLCDFLLQARDAGLYTAITDNGAGGLSSSVGEMAQFSGGADLHLERAPLKHPQLAPWEILISESQERMTLAVPPAQLEALLQLAAELGVEACALGEFTDSGQLRLFWRGRLAGLLELDFLHHGLPQMELEARAPQPPPGSPAAWPALPQGDLTPWLLRVLGRLNVCSKEAIVRQYDHEVQGGTVIKPLVGAADDGPSDAAVLRPLPQSMRAVAVAHGICPRYGDLDAYQMAACALDEALRSLVCVGADPLRCAALDNFCWCDPLPAPNNPQAQERLGQLVQCAKGLHDCAVAYGTPLISGKDSMKNDYVRGDLRISVPPTLLVTAVGLLEDARRAVSMEAKEAGDWVWLLGETRAELGASEFAAEWGGGGAVPSVQPQAQHAAYVALHRAMQRGLVRSAHDCSDGGLAVALAETAFGGGLGLQLALGGLAAREGLAAAALLFSETPGRIVLTSRPEHAAALQECLAGRPLHWLGLVCAAPRLRITGGMAELPSQGATQDTPKNATVGASQEARGSATAGTPQEARGSATAGTPQEARGSATAGTPQEARGSATAGTPQGASDTPQNASAGAPQEARGSATAGAPQGATPQIASQIIPQTAPAVPPHATAPAPPWIEASLEALKAAWQAPLRDI